MYGLLIDKRIRLTNERVNSYGFRLLTSGGDLEQYQRNPVFLYMHERGKVIGYLKDLKVENDEVTGEPVFDEATELSRQCKKQFEVGAASCGVRGTWEFGDGGRFLVE